MRQELRKFVIDNFLFGKNNDSFTDDESFLEKGIIDSTGVLELVAFLQSNYGLVIQDQDLIPENLDSIDNLVRFAETRLYENMVK
jgi:acyl carrier protein